MSLTKDHLIKDIANQKDGLLRAKKKKPTGEQKLTGHNQTVGEPWE